jgi:hypothetical protein
MALAVSPDSGGTGGTNLFAAIGREVFFSANNGTSWTSASKGLPGILVFALAVSPNGAGGTSLFAGTGFVDSDVGGVYLSSNNGINWTPASNGLPGTAVLTLAVSANAAGGTNLFAGTDYPGGVFLSTNNGTSWTSASKGLPGTLVFALAVSPNGVGGTNLFAAGDYGGVYLSTNNGTSWTAVNSGLPNTTVVALAVSGTNVFAGTWGAGVFLSTNNGTSWTAVNTGLPTDTYVHAFAVSGTNLFAGTHGGGVWRRPLSEMVTSVERISTDLPTHFSLDQNYPNPFNPSTIISYELPNAAVVSLKILNTLGQLVETLVDDEKSAGSYRVAWNANVPSGVYFYRLQAGGFVETKKMILLQ